MQPQFLAIDGYHPSALGYQVWGEHLAQWLEPDGRSELAREPAAH